jgi:tetratricopeptide (TPR) repeat protein
MAGFTELVRSLMDERGISLRGLAAQVNYDQGGLSKIVSGQRRCPPYLARLIDDALGAEGRVTDAAAGAPGPPPDAEKIRRALDDALADGMMSGTQLDDWDASVTRYGYRTRDTPSPLLLADLTADLADLRLAIGRHRSASALPRLALTAARMSGLVCLTLVKAGDRQAWRRWGRTARHAAGEAGDPATLSWAAAQEAYGYYYAGDMPGAVASARQAADTARTPCVGAVLAAAIEMRAHAAMGDTRSAMSAFAAAGQIHGLLGGGDLAPSAFGYAESQLRFHAGDALTRLGNTRDASPELERALELCAPTDYTDWAMIRLNRAACFVRDGDADAGLTYAAQTLTALDGAKRQGIITERGRELLAGLTAGQRASRAARELRSLLDDTTGMKEIQA